MDKTLLFSWLKPRQNQPDARKKAESLIGPTQNWLWEYKLFSQQARDRVVVIPTWQCELRCRYCTIKKQDGRVMPPKILEEAIELLSSSPQPELELHFFGGEPFAEWDLICHALEEGVKKSNNRISFRCTTNGFSLTEERLRHLAQYPIHLQISLDGDKQTQKRNRASLTRHKDSYEHSLAHRAELLRELKISHDVIQVVHPTSAHRTHENFMHIVALGFDTIQLNYAMGTLWKEEATNLFAESLKKLGGELQKLWKNGQNIRLVNQYESKKRIRTNREITVDWDGTILLGNHFLFAPETREGLKVGCLDDIRGFSYYKMRKLNESELLKNWYPEEIQQNNVRVGAILQSFAHWMARSYPY
jgi:sulfatase maturation enzyme AslB (radical SAM superfamily)